MEVEKHLKGCQSILDVGCGNNSPISFLEEKYTTVGVDAYKPAIEDSKKRKIHDAYILGDIKS